MEGLGIELGREFAQKELLGKRKYSFPSFEDKWYWITTNLPYMLAVHRTVKNYSSEWEKEIEELEKEILYHQEIINDLHDIESQARQSGKALSAEKRLQLRALIQERENEIKALEGKKSNPPPIMYYDEPLPIDPAVRFVLNNMPLIERLDGMATTYFKTREYVVFKVLDIGLQPIKSVLCNWHRKSADEATRKKLRVAVQLLQAYVEKQSRRL
jgi:hypothetical protein